ncbi:hypothetical protein GCM10009544_57320 [Streptomyces stramineus]|uniref:Uncharacterized protein n=1 Tax=Streptomyces stramineus TaxID=173861 RepID=A0ABN1B252_9ACTN
MRQAPAHADRWPATCSAPTGPDRIAQLTVIEPDGTLFCTGTIAPPPQWTAGVEQYGWSVLYVGKTASVPVRSFARRSGRSEGCVRSAETDRGFVHRAVDARRHSD